MPSKRPTTEEEWQIKRAHDRALYRANPTRAYAASKKWKLKNLDRVNELRRIKRAEKRKLLPIKIKKTPEELKQKAKEWRIKNREKRAILERNRIKRNYDKYIVARREYNKKNRDKFNLHAREWKKKNAAKVSAYNGRRRSLKKERLHPMADMEIITSIYSRAKFISKLTGISQHVDHIIPLNRGGWHHELNLQVIPSSVNVKKRSKAFWLSPTPEYKDWRDVPRDLWPETLAPKYLELIEQNKGVSISWDVAA